MKEEDREHHSAPEDLSKAMKDKNSEKFKLNDKDLNGLS